MLAQNTAFAFFAYLFSEMFFLAELKPDRAACRNSFRGLKRNDVDDDDEDDAIALPNCAIGEVIDGSIPLPCSSFVVIIVLLLLLIMLDVWGKCSVSYWKSEEVRWKDYTRSVSQEEEQARRKELFSFFARKQVLELHSSREEAKEDERFFNL